MTIEQIRVALGTDWEPMCRLLACIGSAPRGDLARAVASSGLALSEAIRLMARAREFDLIRSRG